MVMLKFKLLGSLIFSLIPVIAIPQTRSLDFYIEQGIQNSPLLKDLNNQLSASSIDSLLIRAAKKPQIEARSQLLYSPYYDNFGYDEVITDGGNYQAVAAVTQNIFNRRELENKFQSLEIQKQSIGNSTKLSVAELKKTITDQYITSYSDYSDLQFNRSFLDLMTNENELVKQFAEKGIWSQSDYLSLLVETQGQEVLVKQLKNQYTKDLRLLNQLCGLNDTLTWELLEPQFGLLGASYYVNSPFFMQFVIDSMRLANERNALEIKYRPKINWFADAGVLTSSLNNFYKHFGYSVGASLSVPIYDGRQKDLESRKISLYENTVANYRAKYTKQYDQLLYQLNDELAGTEKVKDQINIQLATTKQLIASLKAQLEIGQVRMTEYINAIKNYRNINRNLNLVNIRMHQIRNEINYLLTQ
jgi:outer membrane protein TolC